MVQASSSWKFQYGKWQIVDGTDLDFRIAALIGILGSSDATRASRFSGHEPQFYSLFGCVANCFEILGMHGQDGTVSFDTGGEIQHLDLRCPNSTMTSRGSSN